MLFHVVLFRPEIPPNTGNLMRLTVNTGCWLHLIHPLGFSLDDVRMRRAGLDYREYASVAHHDDFASFLAAATPERVFAYSQFGDVLYTEVTPARGDALVFGPESVGLPDEILHHAAITATLRIPIAEGGRSLNLANAAAIAIYEGWRQLGFAAPGQ